MFLGIFLWFYFFSPAPFSKKQTNKKTHKTKTEQKKRREKEILLIKDAVW